MDANNSTSQHYKIMEEISDGQLYCADDVVKAGTGGCRDCSWCCEDMCDTIFLDPYDIYALQRGVGKEYKELIEENFIEVGLHNFVSMPHIKDRGNGCGFLTDNKRCSVHSFRPGICRLFPLGRYYHDDTFSYIMQTRGCKAEEHEAVKVRDWLGIEDLKKYEEYVLRWHRVIKKIADFMTKPAEPGVKPKIHERFLKSFYEAPYDTSKEFYSQIYERIDEWNNNEV